MTLRLAILCAGQGAQHAGMFALARTAAGMSARIDAWALPCDADIFANRNAQPLVVGAACAIWQALQARLPQPHIIAGYSVGEVAALAVAGIIEPADAIALARTRASAMDACVDPRMSQGLAAISGLPMAVLMSLLAGVNASSPTYVAIENGEDQAIVGGMSAALDDLRAAVEARGARMQRLPVGVASHTPLMAGAIMPLQNALAELCLLSPRTRLLAGISGAVVADAPAALQSLIAQTSKTVRWRACMDAIAESGATVALELGPGTGLARMLSARHPQITCRAVDDFRSIDGIVRWMTRLAD